MEINNIPHKDALYNIGDDMICIRLSSDDDEACKKVFNIIEMLFRDMRIVYKGIAFEEELTEVARCCESSTVNFYKCRYRNKFLRKGYPELHAEISSADNLLMLLCTYWTSVIYETHVLYIVEEENREKVRKKLEDDVYRDSDSIYSVWPNIKMAIRNQPEADCHNTFLIFIHPEHIRAIKELL